MKILIIEDDHASRLLMKKLLQPLGQCSLACDGPEGLSVFREALQEANPYDLICLDIMMPEMNGQEVLQEIRRLELLKGIGPDDGVKVIMTTALRDYENSLLAFTGGCQSYITKPIDRELLFSEIKKLGLFPAEPEN